MNELLEILVVRVLSSRAARRVRNCGSRRCRNSVWVIFLYYSLRFLVYFGRFRGVLQARGDDVNCSLIRLVCFWIDSYWRKQPKQLLKLIKNELRNLTRSWRTSASIMIFPESVLVDLGWLEAVWRSWGDWSSRVLGESLSEPVLGGNLHRAADDGSRTMSVI